MLQASAIYGARAANGVVLVTTKSGKEGKAVITYNGSATYRNIPKNWTCSAHMSLPHYK